MNYKRIIPCLDVRNGKLTKGIKFQANVDIGDPVESAERYQAEGADELVFYDITASNEGRTLFLDIVKIIADKISIPFCVGGGISTTKDIEAVLKAGADKVSINSSAVLKPELLAEGAKEFGSNRILLGMDVKAVPVSKSIPSGYEIVIQGGRKHMGLDAIEWAKKAVDLGAGEICLNSIDADGTKNGYELKLTRMVADAVPVAVIASGGAGRPEHLLQALTEGGADAALVASIVHYGEYSIPELKSFLIEKGCPVYINHT